MRLLLIKTPYFVLILFAVILGLAPFKGQPHLVEKLVLLYNGDLTKPIDIFDLFYHSSPIILIFLKIYLNFKTRIKK